jgi:hypothetical protein
MHARIPEDAADLSAALSSRRRAWEAAYHREPLPGPNQTLAALLAMRFG